MNSSLTYLVIDEIALEGLEGITLETLWTRLEKREEFIRQETGRQSLPKLNDALKNKIFTLILTEARNERIEFYQLKSPRASLELMDRFAKFKHNTGTLYYQETLPENAYQTVVPVIDKDIRGSCSQYKQRKDCTKSILSDCKTINDFKSKYEHKKDLTNTIVIVASQELRAIALFGESKWQQYTDLRIASYCILEYVARNRNIGYINSTIEGMKFEISSNKLKDKAYYYDKNIIVEKGFVLQFAVNFVEFGKARCLGSILFLPRFKPKHLSPIDTNLFECGKLFTTKKAEELSLDVLKQTYLSGFEESVPLRKRLLSALFARYPQAFGVDETKSKVTTKLPSFRPPHETDFYSNYITTNENTAKIKEEIMDIDDDFKIDPDTNSEYKNSQIESKILKKDFINRIYKIIESYKDLGCSRQTLQRHTDLPMNIIRGAIKNLEESRKFIFKRVELKNKNNTYLFVAKKFENAQVSEERKYYQQLMGEVISEDTKRRIDFIIKFIEEKDFIHDIFDLSRAIRSSEHGPSRGLIDFRTINGVLKKLSDKKLIQAQFYTLSWRNIHKRVTVYARKNFEFTSGSLVKIIDGKLLVVDKIEHMLLKHKFLRFQAQDVEFNDIQVNICKDFDQPKIELDDTTTEEYINSGETTDSQTLTSELNLPNKGIYGKRANKVERFFLLYRFVHYLLVPQEKSPLDSFEIHNWFEYTPKLYHLFPDRTCQLLDILLYMPIHMVRTLTCIQNDVPELYEYWNNPTKKYLTLHRIPPPVRLFLLQNRRTHFKLMELLEVGSQLGLFTIAKSKQSMAYEAMFVTLNTEMHFMESLIPDGPLDYSLDTINDFNKFVADIESHVTGQNDCGEGSSDQCCVFPNLNLHATSFLMNLRASKSAMDDIEEIHAKKIRKKGEKRKAKPAEDTTIRKKAKKTIPKRKEPIINEIEDGDIQKGKKKEKDKIRRPNRQIWNRLEDQFLLQCRLVSMVLDSHIHNPNQTNVSRALMLKLLHEQLPNSFNKETNSLAKRLAKLVSIPSIKKTLAFAFNELDFIDLENLSSQEGSAEAQREHRFRQILNIVQNFKFTSTDFFLSKEERENQKFLKRDLYSLPQTMEEFKNNFVILSVEEEKKDTFFKEPNNFIDIHGYVIGNILLSSLISLDLNLNASKKTIGSKHSFVKAVKRALKYFPESVVTVVFRRMLNLAMIKKIKPKLKSVRIPWIYYRLSAGHSDRLQQYYIPYSMLGDPEKDGNYSAYNVWQFAETLSSNVLGLSEEFVSRFSTEIPDEFYQFSSNSKEVSFRSLISRQLNELRDKDSEDTSKEGKELNDFLIKHIKVKIERSMINSGDQTLDEEAYKQVISDLKRRSKTYQASSMQEFCKEKFDSELSNVKTSIPAIIVQEIVDRLVMAGDLGLKESSLIATIGPTVAKHELEYFFHTCEDKELIFEAGICERTWIHRKFFHHWLIHHKVLQQSAKSHAGEHQPTNKQSSEQEQMAGDNIPAITAEAHVSTAEKSYNTLVFLPKLWRLPDGRIDMNSLFAFFNVILGHLTFEQPCSFVSIREKLADLLPGAQIMELLNYLTILGCVKKIKVPIKDSDRDQDKNRMEKKSNKIDTFCDYFNQKYDLSDEDDDEEMEDDASSDQSISNDSYQTFYEAALNATTKLAAFYQFAVNSFP